MSNNRHHAKTSTVISRRRKQYQFLYITSKLKTLKFQNTPSSKYVENDTTMVIIDKLNELISFVEMCFSDPMQVFGKTIKPGLETK